MKQLDPAVLSPVCMATVRTASSKADIETVVLKFTKLDAVGDNVDEQPSTTSVHVHRRREQVLRVVRAHHVGAARVP